MLLRVTVSLAQIEEASGIEVAVDTASQTVTVVVPTRGIGITSHSMCEGLTMYVQSALLPGGTR